MKPSINIHRYLLPKSKQNTELTAEDLKYTAKHCALFFWDLGYDSVTVAVWTEGKYIYIKTEH